MTYYLIRHKATGRYMPQAKKDRGYSNWNPANNKTDDPKLDGMQYALPVPRLIDTRRKAAMCIHRWVATPNAERSFMTNDSAFFGGSEEIGIKTREDGRKKEDLEVVEVNIVDSRLIADKAFVAGYHALWHKDTKTYTFNPELSPGDPLSAFIAWLKEIGYAQTKT